MQNKAILIAIAVSFFYIRYIPLINIHSVFM